jgi:PAS domain S-box-containing protein
MKRILIVDDKIENRVMLEIFLKKGGYEVLVASNGAEALATAKNNPPDMVVSDILMPVMDGFTLCREWRKNITLQKLPFIFYTATYTDSKDKEFALSLGADQYIVKPQEMKIFLGIIKDVIEKYKGTSERSMPIPVSEEKVFLKEYNEALIRKLEDKLTQVEAAEKELRKKNAVLETEIKEHKLAVEKLRQSEEQFRLISENVDDMIAILDLEGKRIYNNPSYEPILGSVQLLKGTDSFQEIHPDDREKIRKIFQDTIATGKGQRTEYRFIKKDGSINFIESQGNVIRDDNGNVTNVVVVSRDITDRKWLEEDRQKLLNRLQEALSQVKTLDGLLPICSSCKKIRDDTGYWQQVESYIQSHTDATFTHGVCPDCFSKLYPDYKSAEPQQ